MPDTGEPSRLEEVLAARLSLEDNTPARRSLRLVKDGLHVGPARRPDPDFRLAV
jgi:hypothetical protein